MRQAVSAICLLLLCVSCEREERGFRVDPPSARASSRVVVGEVSAGTTQPSHGVSNKYEENAYAMQQGQKLYEAYNCVGCHAHGGGDKGPALMDDKWIYGAEPDQIYATIVEGRPNGMPSFSGKIPDFQVWQIVAYVRSMSGLASTNAAPGREDHMAVKKPENSTPTEAPVRSGAPGSTEGTQ
jgi:cytochrome c oxidase cbb3-type subunit 3